MFLLEMVTLGLLVARDDVIALAMFSVALRSRVAGPSIQQEGMHETDNVYLRMYVHLILQQEHAKLYTVL